MEGGSVTQPKHGAFRWLIRFAVLVGIMVVAEYLLPRHGHPPVGQLVEEDGLSALREIAAAQDAWFASKGVYVRSGIAHLHAAARTPPTTRGPLYDWRIAVADASLPHPAPEGGYFFKALSFEGENPWAPDVGQFAAGAYPAQSGLAHTAFIISHEGIVFRRRWNGPSDTPKVYPADPRKEGWEPAR